VSDWRITWRVAGATCWYDPWVTGVQLGAGTRVSYILGSQLRVIVTGLDGYLRPSSLCSTDVGLEFC
jgi:hypothetical protein